MIKYSIFVFIIATFIININAQVKLEVNGSFEMELSKGGEKSHFYYNGIHSKHKDWRISPAEANLLGNVIFNEQWSLNSRIVLRRNDGTTFNKFSIALLNFLWISENRKIEIAVGRFINPFGSFNQDQLPKDRTFIDVPLTYGFYTNMSKQVGFLQGQQWNTILVDNRIDWGSTNSYYGGYSDGIKLLWNIKPDVSFLEIAIVNGANMNNELNLMPFNLGITGRYSIRHSSSLENGFSFSSGNFLKKNGLTAEISSLHKYTQTMLGVDFKYGKGFFEIRGELNGSIYNSPFIISADNININDVKESKSLMCLAGNIDLRYEPPFLTGSYIAYRLEGIYFGKENGIAWDENVNRHSIGIGYKINRFLLLRSSFSYQSVRNHEWNQTAFRTGFTAHF